MAVCMNNTAPDFLLHFYIRHIWILKVSWTILQLYQHSHHETSCCNGRNQRKTWTREKKPLYPIGYNGNSILSVIIRGSTNTVQLLFFFVQSCFTCIFFMLIDSCFIFRTTFIRQTWGINFRQFNRSENFTCLIWFGNIMLSFYLFEFLALVVWNVLFNEITSKISLFISIFSWCFKKDLFWRI